MAVNGHGGVGAKPAGKRLATEKRHRVDTDLEAKGLPPHDGGKVRGPDIVCHQPVTSVRHLT